MLGGWAERGARADVDAYNVGAVNENLDVRSCPGGLATLEYFEVDVGPSFASVTVLAHRAGHRSGSFAPAQYTPRARAFKSRSAVAPSALASHGRSDLGQISA